MLPSHRMTDTKRVRNFKSFLDRFLAASRPAIDEKENANPMTCFERKVAETHSLQLQEHSSSSLEPHSLTTTHVFPKTCCRCSAADTAARTSEKSRLASANLIEKMADSKGEDLHKVVNEFFRESVKEAGEEFHLAEQEKSEILNPMGRRNPKVQTRQIRTRTA